MVSGFVPGPPRDAGGAGRRRCATRSRRASAHLRTRRIVGSVVLMGARPGRAVLRPVRRDRVRQRARPRSIGLGAVLMMFGFAFLAPLLVRRWRGCSARRWPRSAGPHRRAGARERDPPAAAHRGHRRGADGRPRARRAGGDLRRGPAALRSTRRSTSQVTAALIVQNQDGFSPDPRRTSSTPSRASRASSDVSPCASPSASVEGDGGHDRGQRHRPGDRQLACCTLKWDRGRRRAR